MSDPKSDKILTARGIVTEALPSTLFRVKIEDASSKNQDEEEKVIAKPWIETPIDYAKVKVNLTSSVAILSDNDPYVPYEETKRNFEIRLGSEVVTIPGAGHITSGDGFGPFPQLVEIFEKSF